MAHHYLAASAAGTPEGSVSLAWAYAHGVGVPARDLEKAEALLIRAREDTAPEDEVEALAPTLALAALGACRTMAALAATVAGDGGAAWAARTCRSVNDAVSGRRRDASRIQAAIKNQGVGVAGGNAREIVPGEGGGSADVNRRRVRRDDGDRSVRAANAAADTPIDAQTHRRNTTRRGERIASRMAVLENALLAALSLAAALVTYTRRVLLARADRDAIARDVPMAVGAGAALAFALAGARLLGL